MKDSEGQQSCFPAGSEEQDKDNVLPGGVLSLGMQCGTREEANSVMLRKDVG